MTARAVVLRTAADGAVDLELDTSSKCAGCSGVCMWRRLDRRQVIRVRLEDLQSIGTEVELSLPERYVLMGSLLVHGLPLAALLAGAATGAFVVGSDLGVLVGAALGMALAFAMTPWLRRTVERRTLTQLRIEPVTS